MAKETIIAKLRGKLDFTEGAQTWLSSRRNVWFAREGGDALFVEFRGRFAEDFSSSVELETRDYFRRIGLIGGQAPQVKILETYRGSFIVDAALTMAGGMGTVYSTVKTFSELPKLADGLEDLKKRIEKRFQKKAELTASELIISGDNQPYSANPPPHLLRADFTIDARPLRSLQPDVAQAHKIHLSVAISRSGLILENLGSTDMRDVRIGIFSSSTKRNQWSFTDSYMGLVSLLSASQTISKRLEEFEDDGRRPLDLDTSNPVYVDCWIQDEHGIYLFNFYLDR